MRAWVVDHVAPIDDGPLRRVDRDEPQPAVGQVRLRVICCGVCRTDLHLAEGDLAPRRPAVVPGHEIVGRVDALGPTAHRFAIGDRIGVAWLATTDGTCGFCRRGDENLCESPTFTGWDSDGGYADACLVDERYAYHLPDSFGDEQAAPLLCAGIIGYRALRAAAVPTGGRLGIYGFGGSAHLTAQVALHLGMRVHVLTRGEQNRQLAKALGVDSVGEADAQPPSRSTARSCSRQPASWSRSRCVRSTPAARSPSPGSGSPRSRRSTTRASCSMSGDCAASPPIPAMTARSSCSSRTGSASGQRPSVIRWTRPRPRCPTSPTAASAGQPSCTTDVGAAPTVGPGASGSVGRP